MESQLSIYLSKYHWDFSTVHTLEKPQPNTHLKRVKRQT